MRYDIVKDTDATQQQLDANPRLHNGYYLVRNDSGQYDAEFVRNFVNNFIQLNLEEYTLATNYGNYYHMDDNRAKSGQWMAATIIGRTLHKRDIGDITENEKLELEAAFLNPLSLLAGGHWKTAQLMGLAAKTGLSTQGLQDLADEFLTNVNDFIVENY
jgi:hypothetical protein